MLPRDRERFHKLQGEYDELLQAKDQLAVMSAGFEDEAIALRKQVKELEEQNATLVSERATPLEALALERERCLQVEADNKKLESERDELQQHLRTTEKGYLTLSGQYNDAHKEIAELKVNLRDAISLQNAYKGIVADNAADKISDAIDEDIYDQEEDQLNDQGVLELARLQGEVRALERLLEKCMGGA